MGNELPNPAAAICAKFEAMVGAMHAERSAAMATALVGFKDIVLTGDKFGGVQAGTGVAPKIDLDSLSV